MYWIMKNLKNKFIMAPIKLGYCNKQGFINKEHLNFYDSRSKNIGAVTPEPLYMNAGLREIPTQLGIDNNDKMDGLKDLTNLFYGNGAKSIAHLNHPGRMANPKIPGNYWWSSTDKACENGGAVPKKMNREMMDKVIDLFIESAQRAVASGFDMIELQFGHGYLIAQFLSPAVNDRDDEYGGSFENRIKFPLELANAVRKAIAVPIIIRISGDEIIPNGFHIQEMIKFTKELEKIRIDAIHVSAGSACSTPPWFFQHMFIPKGKTWEMASSIQKEISIPVIYVGQINTVEDIKILENKHNAKYIAVGRALVADENFIGKYLKEVEGNIRPCLACAEGCLGGVKKGEGLGCVVNPLLNTGLHEVTKTSTPKKYAVIGAGLAGMQTAITLKDKGHKVDLFEKNKPGGQFNLAYLPPNKMSLKRIIDYYIKELSSKKINIINTEAIKSDLINAKYDGVIIATGAVPNIPDIKGLKEYYWTEFLEDEQLPENQTVLVIGGGLIGLEIASKLVDNNNKVYIVEMLEEIARGMEMIEKALTIKKLKEKNTEIITGHKVIEINKKTILIEGKEGQKEIKNIDKIVVAIGMKSYVPFKNVGNIPVYITGDAQKVSKAQDAIHNAYELALNI